MSVVIKTGETNGEMFNTKIIDEEELERRHFHKIINAFRYYREHSDTRHFKTMSYIQKLSHEQQILLKPYRDHLQDLGFYVDLNQKFLKLMIKDATTVFNMECIKDHNPNMPIPKAHMEKVNTVLKQIVREWSSVGQHERDATFQPIIAEIEHHFKHCDIDREDLKVLVPGAGLGRLAFEIAYRGFSCQGNEYSFFMLIASHFILNQCQDVNIHCIYPWLHEQTNCLDHQNQILPVKFPDVNPSTLANKSTFSMTAGDFLDVYTESNEWDCVATSFFIDCGNNIISIIQTIYNIIKPGGIWVNMGPLLYHFADVPNEFSIEPSYDFLKQIIIQAGFTYEKENTSVPTTYSQNPHSMVNYSYKSIFFVCRKKL